MKAITSAIIVAFFAFVLASCMTDREYQLRKQDMEAKKAWPATYQPVKIKGPLTLDKDSELVVTVPNQPYSPTSIPDGQAIQAQFAKDVITTGAFVGGAIYSIHKANGSTTNTTINNATAE